MAFSYDKLWKLLIDKKMTKENFRVIIKASPTTIAAMGKGEGISPKVLDRICTAFECQPGDIMEHIPPAPDEVTGSLNTWQFKYNIPISSYWTVGYSVAPISLSSLTKHSKTLKCNRRLKWKQYLIKDTEYP